MLTSDALRIFKDQYGSDTASEKDAVFRVKLGPLTLRFPNPGGLKAHDLHHVLLGASPTFWGEVEVSVFELRGGVPNALIAFLCVGSVFLGALVRPLRVARWWRRYRGVRTLYREGDCEALLETDVDDLRARVGLGGER